MVIYPPSTFLSGGRATSRFASLPTLLICLDGQVPSKTLKANRVISKFGFWLQSQCDYHLISDMLTTLWNTLRHPLLIISKHLKGQLGPLMNHKKVSLTFLLYSRPALHPRSVKIPCCESGKSDCDIFAFSRPALTLKKTSGQLEPLVNHIFGPIRGEHYPLKLNSALPILGVTGRRPASAS